MVRTRVPVVWVIALCLAVPVTAAAGDRDLAGSMEVFRVVKTDAGKEQFVPADEAKPRDIIEYRLTYRNQGEDPLRNILITDPIPVGTRYVGESVTTAARFQVEFSIDGAQTYAPWPVQIVHKNNKGEETVTEATPDMVTHIRWVLVDEFAPSGEVTVSYRTIIE